jgi:hypothetical protein
MINIVLRVRIGYTNRSHINRNPIDLRKNYAGI